MLPSENVAREEMVQGRSGRARFAPGKRQGPPWESIVRSLNPDKYGGIGDT